MENMEHNMVHDAIKAEHKPMNIIGPETGWKRFLPIIVIFSIIVVITAVTLLIHGRWDPIFAMRVMMGSFFGIFGFFKVINLSAFAEAYSTYDLLAMRSEIYAHAYPFIEIILSALYFTNTGGVIRDIFTLLLMSIGIVGVYKKLRVKEEIPCACLGLVFKIPMTWVTLAEDALMAIEAILMILLTLKVL